MTLIDIPLGLTTVERIVITADKNIAGNATTASKSITLNQPDISKPIWFGCLPVSGIDSININIVTADNSYSATILSSHYDKALSFDKGKVSEIPVDMGKVRFQEGEISRGVQIRLREANKSGGTVNPITANGFGVEWSITNFQSLELDAAQTYNAALYTDATCKNCVVAWDFLAKGGNGTKGGNASNPVLLWDPTSTSFKIQKWAGFFFSGLEPSTTYYVKVTAGNGDYGIKKVTTAASKVVTMPATAAVGDYFIRRFWRNDLGQRSRHRFSRLLIYSTQFTHLLPPQEQTLQFRCSIYLVTSDVNMGLFSTIGKAIVGNLRLKTWDK